MQTLTNVLYFNQLLKQRNNYCFVVNTSKTNMDENKPFVRENIIYFPIISLIMHLKQPNKLKGSHRKAR